MITVAQVGWWKVRSPRVLILAAPLALFGTAYGDQTIATLSWTPGYHLIECKDRLTINVLAPESGSDLFVGLEPGGAPPGRTEIA
jgi:hypothetical protein